MKLRPYQAAAVERTIEHFRVSNEPGCLVLPTGAGKSLVIAELARLARGRVVVLAHVKELCRQNHAKFLAVGGKAGLFAAGLARKDTDERVTFASIQSLVGALHHFADPISLLIVDECHRVDAKAESQYQRAIDWFRSKNPSLKLLGLTATPYRLGMGFSYRYHPSGRVMAEAEKPFDVCLAEISLRELVDDGFLVPPRTCDVPIAQYDFSSLEAREERPVNELLVRHPRVTQAICEQVVELAELQKRRGVMVFAATAAHAREVAGYLPALETGLILGEMGREERDRVVEDFRSQKLRYLVNVAVLTTGFDAPHVDFIALLRSTESVALYQQIVGRGLRLSPGKVDCLVMDYASNGFDVYSPEVAEPKPRTDAMIVAVNCPACGYSNQFWGQVDDDGHVVEHWGRRCQAFVRDDAGKRVRCDYRFRFKECQRCQAENDIAARTCSPCGERLVDPDDLLKRALGLRDAVVLRVAGVTFAAAGSVLTVTYHDEDGMEVPERFDMSAANQRAVFNRVFARRLASGRRPLELVTAEQAERLAALLPCPDFVIARRKKGSRGGKWLRVEHRVFDYLGPRRTADQPA